MKCSKRVGVAFAATLLAATGALADPNDPMLKFWVQITGANASDIQMLPMLVAGDTRVCPIVRVNVPNVFASCTTFANNTPEGAASTALCLVEALRGGWNASNPMLPGPGSYQIGIQLAGFGSGGREPNSFYFPAPALARPPGIARPSWVPGSEPSPFPFPADNTLEIIGHQPWQTPWFEDGPKDCSHWLRVFAETYRQGILQHDPSNVSLYVPTRLIFDMEEPAGECCASWVVTDTIPRMMGGDIQGIPVSPDSRAFSIPVRGVPISDLGPFFPNDGQVLFDVWDNFRPGSDPELEPNLRTRMKLANINRQAQNAAFFRAVKEPPAAGFTAAIDAFGQGYLPLRWSNFLFQQSDYVLDPDLPPYDASGSPIRRVSFRDTQQHYEAYHNYADFNSPGSYGFLSTNAGLLNGRTRSEWMVQAFRETLESIVHSPTSTPDGIRPSDYITPWISGLNEYFVSADHLRKTLAMARAKTVNEFNVFMGGTSATHDHLMANWTKFRHVADQVWGFDINPAQSSLMFGLSPFGANPPINQLHLSDFAFVPVSSQPDPSQFPGNMHRATIQTVFTVHKAHEPSPPFHQFSVRDSNYLRVNVEFVAQCTDALFDGNPDTCTVQILRSGGKWSNVPMTQVGAGATGVNGTRVVLTGQVSNAMAPAPAGSHPLVVWPDPQTDTGTVTALVSVTSPGTFDVKFDLVQIVGVDKGDNDVDWNHDFATNYDDLIAYLDDFVVFWQAAPINSAPFPYGTELRAIDADSNGIINLQDICGFKALLSQVVPLTTEQSAAFDAAVASRNLGAPPCN